jgi:anhydro-N-acetylmuramic acid kinase
MLLDGLAFKGSDGKQRVDRNGRLGRGGRSQALLLDTLLSHPYLSKKPPKSTGREEFGDPYIASVFRQVRAKHLSLEDALATSCDFVAYLAEEA